jgi:hypothetical protein
MHFMEAGRESDEGQIPEKMNNFFAFLPGGYRRELTEDGDLEERRVIEVMDELLAGEFAYLDVTSLINLYNSVSEEMNTAIGDGTYREKEAYFDKKNMEVKAAKEMIRPLFNRMIEMGFDPVFLIR